MQSWFNSRGPLAIVALTLAGLAMYRCTSAPPTVTPACTSNDECRPGWACIAGECARLCISSATCPAGEVCTEAGVCAPGEMPEECDCDTPPTPVCTSSDSNYRTYSQ